MDADEDKCITDFNVFDKNKNGIIDAEELNRIFGAKKLPEYRLEEMFDFSDTNKNGLLDAGEFYRGMADMKTGGNGVMNKFFEDVDLDGNGSIARREYIDYYRGVRRPKKDDEALPSGVTEVATGHHWSYCADW